MGQDSSFDIVSKVDLQEIDNAVQQAMKEVHTRYDFKDSKSQISLNRQEKKLVLFGDDDTKLKNLKDILATKLAKRSVSIKAVKYGNEEPAMEGGTRLEAEIVMGLPQEKAKDLVKVIKEMKLKVQPSIQGEQIRVSAKSKDDLQVVIQKLRNTPLDIPIQFENYR